MAIIEVERLEKRYGERAVVDGVSFAVEEGEIFGILGPNGAGKTTTVECLEGLRSRDGGEIRVAGIDPQRSGGELPHVLGVQLQESELPERLTVGEAMSLYSGFYRAPVDWRELIDELGLSASITTQFRRLSGGQKQRLFIALALVGGPRVAVLDELTTGLDPQARRDTWDLIESVRDRGVTVLMVTHFMEEAQRLCDRLAVIDAGAVVALDTPAAVVARHSGPPRLRFRPSAPLPWTTLENLPGVRSIEATGDQIAITGHEHGDEHRDEPIVQSVMTALSASGVTAWDLHVDQPTLDDAFLALTGQDLLEGAR
jgi:ABC-2 type transport system ATP-binding protein